MADVEKQFVEGKFIDMFNVLRSRELRWQSESEFSILGLARQVLDWHDKTAYCQKSGTKLVPSHGGMKLKSTDNSVGHLYPRTDPCVIMCVISKDGEKCLLGRGKRFPPGMFSCLAGFMEVCTECGLLRFHDLLALAM